MNTTPTITPNNNNWLGCKQTSFWPQPEGCVLVLGNDHNFPNHFQWRIPHNPLQPYIMCYDSFSWTILIIVHNSSHWFISLQLCTLSWFVMLFPKRHFRVWMMAGQEENLCSQSISLKRWARARAFDGVFGLERFSPGSPRIVSTCTRMCWCLLIASLDVNCEYFIRFSGSSLFTFRIRINHIFGLN